MTSTVRCLAAIVVVVGGLFWWFSRRQTADLASTIVPKVIETNTKPVQITTKDLFHQPAMPCPIRFSQEYLPFTHERGERGDYWLPETMGGGAAWFDLDLDGWQDLYLVQGRRSAELSDVIFGNRFGELEGLPSFVVPTDSEFGMGVAAGDCNSDGFDDLYVTSFRGNRYYRNNGDGTLQDRSAFAKVGSDLWGTSAGFGDLDGDGDLDLVVANYAQYVQIACSDPVTGERRYCGPDKYRGRPALIYRNEGNGTFSDVSSESRVDQYLGKCLGVVIARLDDSNPLPDVFIANDLTNNFYFRNKGGMQFEEVGEKINVARSGDGVCQANMGVACGDYDNDDRLDLLSTHYYNEYDTIWRNLGPRGFRDSTKSARLYVPTLTQLSWGTHFFDADNDGWLDIFITSGHINRESGSVVPYEMPPQLFWNRGELGPPVHFDEVSSQSGDYFRDRHIGRGSAACDFDRDGLVDLAVVHHHKKSVLVRNATQAGQSVVLAFVGVQSPRDGHGVRARVLDAKGQRLLTREIHGGGSYLSADARELVVGLGNTAKPFVLEIKWPSGQTDRVNDLAAGHRYTFIEGKAEPIQSIRMQPSNKGIAP